MYLYEGAEVTLHALVVLGDPVAVPVCRVRDLVRQTQQEPPDVATVGGGTTEPNGHSRADHSAGVGQPLLREAGRSSHEGALACKYIKTKLS